MRFKSLLKGKRRGRIYLDHAASTPVEKKVKKAMDPFFNKYYANPSALHKEGRDARGAVEWARRTIAESINAHQNEIIFTSGGTESNGTAVFGVLSALNEEGIPFEKMHIITTAFEHPSVSAWIKYAASKGVAVDYLRINKDGIIDPEELKALLREETVLVSIMYVNNEIGTIQPIRECSKIIREFQKNKNTDKNLPYFHTDSSQAPLFLSCSVSIGADMIVFDGQKIYGPKGIGVLYKKSDVKIKPLIKGGSQEGGLRGGTEPTPLIIGMATAVKMADKRRMIDSGRLNRLRDYFIKELQKEVKDVEINGGINWRIPNNLNISIPGLDNEYAIIGLDNRGVACSAGAACSLKESAEGRVNSVKALGKGDIYTTSAVRFSLGRRTSKSDIKYVVKALKEVSKIGKKV